MSDNVGDGGVERPGLSCQLKPLAEMEVVGACRRGRRRGRRNRTAAERQSEMEQRRRSKNARERQRVENVKNEYAKLQIILGLEFGLLDQKSKEKRRHCKLRVLTAAIHRIRSLMAERNRLQAESAAPPPRHGEPTPSLQPPVEEVNFQHAAPDYTSSHDSSLPAPYPPNCRLGRSSSLYTHNEEALPCAFSSPPSHPYQHPVTPNPYTPECSVYQIQTPRCVDFSSHVSYYTGPPPISNQSPSKLDELSPYPHLQVCGQPAPYTGHLPQFFQPSYCCK